MLRASTADLDASLNSIREGASGDDGAVPESASLLAFSEAIHARDREKIDAARTAIAEALGDPAAVDSAAVCAHFDAITRVADATGVQLDSALENGSAGIREELGLDAFNTTVE